ncbi:hypothetical protein [Paludibaculum fermentans]
MSLLPAVIQKPRTCRCASPWALWAGLLPGLYMALVGVGGLVWLAFAGA